MKKVLALCVFRENKKYFWRITGTQYVSPCYFETFEECAKDALTRCLQSLGKEIVESK